MNPTSMLPHRLLAPLEPLIVRLLEQLFEIFTILFIKLEGFDDGNAIEGDPNSSHEYCQANPINNVSVKFSHLLSNSEGWMLTQFLLVSPIDYEIEVGVGVGEPYFMEKWLDTDGVVQLLYLVRCELSRVLRG